MAILTQFEYEAALKAASVFFDHEPALCTPDAERFENLLSLIEAYEAREFLPDPSTSYPLA